MFKKNKDKVGNVENSLECLPSPQNHAKQIVEPELFSTPDIIIINDNKAPVKSDNIELDCKTNIVDNHTTLENAVANVSKETEQVTVMKEEFGRARKVSSRIKDNPVEVTVTKTVEDILNDISSKIANQTEVIDEENLIDELADLNEDLNSVCNLNSLNL